MPLVNVLLPLHHNLGITVMYVYVLSGTLLEKPGLLWQI